MEPEIITKRMVGECSSSVTDSSVTHRCEYSRLLFQSNLIVFLCQECVDFIVIVYL